MQMGMHYNKRWRKLSFSVCNYTASAKQIWNVHLPLYITLCIQICTTKAVFSPFQSMEFSFWCYVFKVSCFLSKTCSMKPNTFKRWRFVYYLPCTRLQNFVNVSPLRLTNVAMCDYQDMTIGQTNKSCQKTTMLAGRQPSLNSSQG